MDKGVTFSATVLLLCFVLLVDAGLSADVEEASQTPISISNVEPRRDDRGNILDVHDGALEYFAGRYYLYGTRYSDTDGFGDTNRYVCYSSSDLKAWHFEGLLLKQAPRRVYYRPYVRFNRLTKKYVLWYNADNKYGVAVSDAPQGPYTIVNPDVRVKYSEQAVGDFGLFVDQDGTGYIIYTALNVGEVSGAVSAFPKHHRISVERLAADYLGSTLENSGFIAGNVESPALFRKDGTYYLLFDNTCAFCVNGSGVRVYTSQSPFGPYTYRNNVNLRSDQPVPVWTVPGTGRPDTIWPAQQTHVSQIPVRDGSTLFIWMGDRWGSTPDGIKGHDFQVWLPLDFDESGGIRPFRQLESWQLSLQNKGGESGGSK